MIVKYEKNEKDGKKNQFKISGLPRTIIDEAIQSSSMLIGHGNEYPTIIVTIILEIPDKLSQW